MTELIVDNIYIEIKHAPKEIENQIREALSFEVKEFNMGFGTPPPIRYLYNRRTKLTYTGLLDYILEILKANNEEYKIIDNRIAWEENAEFGLVNYLDAAETIPFKLRDYQQRVIDKLRPRDIVRASTGAGKALTLETNILTPSGWKKMRNIHIDDVVYDENGKKTTVIGEYPQGKKDVYEISFKDGTKIKCCKDHLWKYIDSLNNVQVDTTEEIMTMNNISIPVNKQIQFDNIITYDSYLLGLIKEFTTLDDNILNCYLFANLNEEFLFVKEKISAYGEFIDEYYFRILDKNFLYEVETLKNDTLSNKYLYLSIQDRQALFNAITLNRNEYWSCIPEKIKFIKFLAYSLGYRIQEQITTRYNEVVNDQYYLHFYKIDKLDIVDIKKLDYQEEMKCITVDSPQSTYICENFIVTHNTAVMAAAIAKFNVKPVSILADKLSLCTQLQSEFSKFLGEKVGLVGGGVRDVRDITVFSAQSVTEEMVKDTKLLMIDECFTYETKIQLAGGIKKAIGTLVEHRELLKTYKVLSYNTKTKQKEYKPIIQFKKLYLNKPLVAVLIKYNDQLIRLNCTNDHKFYSVDKDDYIEAKDLQENEPVYIFDVKQTDLQIGHVFKVVLSPNKPEFVYDIEVEGNHNFFAEGVLVHNCHHCPCATMAQISKWCKDAYYRIGVSATPWRDDNADLIIDAIFAKQDPSTAITASTLIEQNYLVPCTIYWVLHKQIFKHKYYNNLYDMAIVKNKLRNETIVKITYQMRVRQDATVLILVQRVEHGETLLRMLKEILPCKSFFTQIISPINKKKSMVKCDSIEFLSGEDLPTRREAVLQATREKKCQILIGTTIFDEGIDCPSIDTIILAGAGKSSTRAFQRVGRGLRLFEGKTKCTVFDFLDYTPIFQRQAKVRNKMYKTEDKWDIKEFPSELLNFSLKKINNSK